MNQGINSLKLFFLASLLGLAGCEEGGGELADQSGLPGDLPTPYSCFERTLGTIEIEELAFLRPVREPDSLKEGSWAPIAIIDVAVFRDGFLLLDGPAAEITVLDPSLRIERSWGRMGRGPGEMEHPSSVAFDHWNQSVWVGDLRKLSQFTVLGEFIKSFRLPSSFIDFVLTDTLVFTFLHSVARIMPIEDQPLLSRIQVQRSEVDTLVTVNPDEMKPPHFILPGPTEGRLKSSNTLLLNIFETAGVVDVYSRDSIIGTVISCVPSQLSKYYARQTERILKSGQPNQIAFDLISDAMVLRDTLFVAVPVPDKSGRFHIDAYSVEGTYFGSFVLNEVLASGQKIMFVGDSALMQYSLQGAASLYKWH